MPLLDGFLSTADAIACFLPLRNNSGSGKRRNAGRAPQLLTRFPGLQRLRVIGWKVLRKPEETEPAERLRKQERRERENPE